MSEVAERRLDQRNISPYVDLLDVVLLREIALERTQNRYALLIGGSVGRQCVALVCLRVNDSKGVPPRWILWADHISAIKRPEIPCQAPDGIWRRLPINEQQIEVSRQERIRIGAPEA